MIIESESKTMLSSASISEQDTMKKNKTLILHVGLPKTASSFLENNLFDQLSKLPNWSYNDPGIVAGIRNIVFPNQSSDKDVSLARAIEQLDQQNILVSYDGLCGDPYQSFANRMEILDRLKRAIPIVTVKIFFMTRNQADWIESIYRQSLHEYYCTPWKKFIIWDYQSKVPYPSIRVHDLCWGTFAETW